MDNFAIPIALGLTLLYLIIYAAVVLFLVRFTVKKLYQRGMEPAKITKIIGSAVVLLALILIVWGHLYNMIVPIAILVFALINYSLFYSRDLRQKKF